MDNLIGWLGVILIVNACWMAVTRLSARTRATGRVVGHEARQTTPSDSTSPATTLYHPVIEFADRDGRHHRFTAVGGDPAPRPASGTRVAVRFARGRPERAFLAGFANTWAMPAAWAAAGALALYLA